jgi:hypothetical protein
MQTYVSWTTAGQQAIITRADEVVQEFVNCALENGCLEPIPPAVPTTSYVPITGGAPSTRDAPTTDVEPATPNVPPTDVEPMTGDDTTTGDVLTSGDESSPSRNVSELNFSWPSGAAMAESSMWGLLVPLLAAAGASIVVLWL